MLLPVTLRRELAGHCRQEIPRRLPAGCAQAEGGRCKLVTDTRIHIRIVALIFIDGPSSQQRWQPLVISDGLNFSRDD